jgi:hypothetical protein
MGANIPGRCVAVDYKENFKFTHPNLNYLELDICFVSFLVHLYQVSTSFVPEVKIGLALKSLEEHRVINAF